MKSIGASVLSFLFFLSLIAVSVMAASCSSDVSVSTSGPTTSVTTGTGSVITSTSTATSSSCSSDVTVSATGVTVSDPVSGKYSSQTISTSGITHTFTLVPGTSGTYNYSVTVGSVTSTEAQLIVVNPDALLYAGAPSARTVTASSSFPLNITITNSLGSDINTSYSLSLPTGLSASAGDATSSNGYMIPAGSSRTLQWTILAASTYTGTASVSFSAGSSTGVFTSSVTGPAAVSSNATATPSTSSSGTVTNPTATPTATATATPAPTATKEAVITPEPDAVTIIDSANEVSGTFTDTSSSFSLSFTAGSSGFEGDLTYRLPLDYADYLSGKIVFNPAPSNVSAGSVIATWKDVKLAADAKFAITVEVAKKLEKAVLDQFTSPTVVARKGGAATPKPVSPTLEAGATAVPIQQGGGINWALVIGIIVIIAVAVVAYLRTSKH